MTIRPTARPAAQVRRRTPKVRRRSAGLTPVRAGALLAMIVSALAVYGMVSSPVFGLERMVVRGAVLTPDETIRTTLGVGTGTNLVSLDTSALVERLEDLPTVRRADVSAGIPGILSVRVEERRPILVWASTAGRFLVDVEGRAVAELAPDAPVPQVDEDGQPLPAGATTGRSLAVIHDDRVAGGPERVGAAVDALDLDVARRLGALEPRDLDSAARALAVHVTDDLGFVVRPTGSDAAGWTAIFGFYTASEDVRAPVIVPDQVRLLRSLLGGREPTIGVVRLASATDGTYLPRPSPSPSPSAKASSSP